MAKAFSITRTTPWTYIDEGNNPVNGTKVYFTILKYNEGHEIDVPDFNDTAFVEKRINAMISARERLAALGG